MKKGLLLINLGTPEKAELLSVAKYLAEFLSDKRVIDLPGPLRYFLLYGLILPFRTPSSTEAYRSIWTKEGSPLLMHSQNLVKKIQEKLDTKTHQVALGMRYGHPSIKQAFSQLEACEQITVLPLYPQYSSAATGSSIEQVMKILSQEARLPSLNIIRDFYKHPAFIHAQSQLIKPHLTEEAHLLFSYHGLPERHLHKTGCDPVCQNECKPITSSNQSCYRAQCFETTQLLAQALNLNKNQYSLGFQSRLGRTPWIQPYTDELISKLRTQGIKHLLVACPSFVADCLETLEEIGIRAREQWLSLGGESFKLIPCLNAEEGWVEAILSITHHE